MLHPSFSKGFGTLLGGNSDIGVQEQSLLFNLFKEFDKIDSSHKWEFFSSSKRPVFLNACATCFELPSNLSTMV